MDTHESRTDLAILSQVIASVSRRARLSTDDALDFSQTVHLRLVESDYAALRRFDGRSSLSTYLTVVVRRMLLDWRRTTHGKWRPSRWAVAEGRTAVTLDRLMHRDGMSSGEAVQVMQCGPAAPPEAELRAVADRVPVRVRRRMVSDRCLYEVGTFVDPLEQVERIRAARQTKRALAAALRQLPRDERRLIDMRYRRRRSLTALAKELGIDAKALYRRCNRAVRALRRSLEADGVLGRPHATWRLDEG